MCVEGCRLRVYPQMDNGSKCERCGLAHSDVWQQARFASIDLVWSKGYNAGSALMGTTQSQMGHITHAVLLSEGYNVSLRASQVSCCVRQPWPLHRPLLLLTLRLALARLPACSCAPDWRTAGCPHCSM